MDLPNTDVDIKTLGDAFVEQGFSPFYNDLLVQRPDEILVYLNIYNLQDASGWVDSFNNGHLSPGWLLGGVFHLELEIVGADANCSPYHFALSYGGPVPADYVGSGNHDDGDDDD